MLKTQVIKKRPTAISRRCLLKYIKPLNKKLHLSCTNKQIGKNNLTNEVVRGYEEHQKCKIKLTNLIDEMQGNQLTFVIGKKRNLVT
jgi:hypothetical protein